MLPFAPIVSVLIELDKRIGYPDCFTHASGKQVRSPELKRNLIAVLLASATNGLTRMAEASGISYDILAWTAEWYVPEDTLRTANLALVDFHQRLPLTAAFRMGTCPPQTVSGSPLAESRPPHALCPTFSLIRACRPTPMSRAFDSSFSVGDRAHLVDGQSVIKREVAPSRKPDLGGCGSCTLPLPHPPDQRSAFDRQACLCPILNALTVFAHIGIAEGFQLGGDLLTVRARRV